MGYPLDIILGLRQQPDIDILSTLYESFYLLEFIDEGINTTSCYNYLKLIGISGVFSINYYLAIGLFIALVARTYFYFRLFLSS